jgi:hypothetical protein
MLDFLRKRKRNWVIILFLGIIVISFALFVGSGSFAIKALGTLPKSTAKH